MLYFVNKFCAKIQKKSLFQKKNVSLHSYCCRYYLFNFLNKLYLYVFIIYFHDMKLLCEMSNSNNI